MGQIKVEGFFSNDTLFNNDLDMYQINTEKKFININRDIYSNYLNLDIYFYETYFYNFKIIEINEMINITQINCKFNITKGKKLFFNFDTINTKFLKFESFILLSITNSKNLFKLVNLDGTIITSNNFLLAKPINIEGVFIQVNENDIFEISLIPEKISKRINFNKQTFETNILEINKEWDIDYIYSIYSNILFYEPINKEDNNMEIYQLNFSNFNIDDAINNKLENYKIISGSITIEPYNSQVVLKRCKKYCLYMKYENQLLDFEYTLTNSEIIYLFMDFEYKINYNENITNIKIKKLNNYDGIVIMKCQDISIDIQSIEQIIDIGNCKGEFILKGNNNLIYFFLPISLNKDLAIFNNTKSFILNNIKDFIFIPNNDDFNSINLYINNNNLNNKNMLSFSYSINHNIIPYSRKIKTCYMVFEENANIVLPNFKQNHINNEEYYIYFIFEEKISNIEIKVIYENIIILEEFDINIIPSGIHLLQLEKQDNYYINIIEYKETNNLIYSILRNGIYDEQERNVKLKSDSIFFKRTSFNENIRIKIENRDEIILSVSSEYLYDLDMIYMDKNILIEQLKNILNIKFNTSLFESKIEFQIVIIEDNDIHNLSNYLLHKIIKNNSFIYKKIICSYGIEPISVDIDIDKYFNDNTYITAIILGKQYFREGYNYLYYEPAKFTVIKEKTKKKNKNIGIIIGITISILVLISIIIAFGIYYYHKRKIKFNTIPNLK